ncbi:MAG: DUF3592 domain-containing protein [Gemmataceae bacterium]|nr:DUF3592 domain-containing protein [Gemmataceae bacterium]
MESGCPTPPVRRAVASALALLTFVLAIGVLFWLERWAWESALGPHLALVRRQPVPAVVLAHRLDEVGDGPHLVVYPRAVYRYRVESKDFESAVIRPRHFIGEDGSCGEVRFAGPERQEQAQNYLARFPMGQEVTAWVDRADPREAMLVRQKVEPAHFLWTLLPAVVVPFLWLFLVGILRATAGRPGAGWVACGWGLLSLASLGPAYWQYRQLLGETESPLPLRALAVGAGVVAAALWGSLLPRTFRSALAGGLILSFTGLLALGTVSAVLAVRFEGIFDWFGWETNPNELMVRFLEYGLVCGVGLGLLLGIGGWCGVVTVSTSKNSRRQSG